MAIPTENEEVQFSSGIRESKRTTERVREAAANSTECSDSRRIDRSERIRRNLLAGLTVGRITRELAVHRAQAVGASRAKTRAPIGARAQLDSLVPDALKTLQSRMRKHQDARVAFEVLSATGVIPSAAEQAVAGRPTDQDLIANYRLRAATQLGLVALARNEVYGSQLPVSREELDRRMRDASSDAPTGGASR